jgi:hypothetical protein
MQNSGPVAVLGAAIIAITALVIVIPVLRRRADAFTAWNLVLFGGAMYMGVGGLAVKYGDFHWRELQWFQPTRHDVQQFVIGAVIFYGTLFLSYFWLSSPRQIAARFLNQWPPMSLALVLSAIVCFSAIILGAALAQGVIFLGAAFTNMAHKALVFAVVFSFCYWYRHKRQLPMLFLFIGVFVLAALDAMVVFHGRRLLLSVVTAPLICMYWLDWRYRPVRWNLVRLATATMVALSVAAAYSTFRHFSKGTGGPERTFATTVEAMKGATTEKAISSVTANPYFYFSQYCTHYSLLTLQLLDRGEIEIEPLLTFKFLAAYPIPRAIWPGKPQPLSTRIVRDVLHMGYKTNWGTGIVGSGYHQGGLVVIVLYAYLMVVGIRIIDDALVRQPDNVFLLGILCTAAPHLVTLIRGEISTMTVEVVEAVVFAWGLSLIARWFFGTSPPRTHAAISR